MKCNIKAYFSDSENINPYIYIFIKLYIYIYIKALCLVLYVLCVGVCGSDGGKRKHMGLDIVCSDGSTVFAPFDVKLTGKAVPYKKTNPINDGVALSGGGQSPSSSFGLWFKPQNTLN